MLILEQLLQNNPLGLIVGRELRHRRVSPLGEPDFGGLAFGVERRFERRAVCGEPNRERLGFGLQ